MLLEKKLRRLSPRQQGATLIEILVSVLVIAFGVLAMAAVQSNAIRFQKTTEYRAIATLLASDLADRMRANELGVQSNAYAYASDTTEKSSYQADKITADNQGSKPNCGTVSSPTPPSGEGGGEGSDGGALLTCTPAQMVQQDLYEWRSRVRVSLPGASVHIGQIQNGAVELWIAWTEAEDKDAGGNTRAARSQECPPADVWEEGDKDPIFQCAYLRVAL